MLKGVSIECRSVSLGVWGLYTQMVMNIALKIHNLLNLSNKLFVIEHNNSLVYNQFMNLRTYLIIPTFDFFAIMLNEVMCKG